MFYQTLLSIVKPNKYTTIYISICKKAQARASTKREAKQLLGYVESHHVVPKSIIQNNILVHLTVKEHFICHRLLTKMFESPIHKQKMYFALASFLRKNKYQQRFLSSRQYEKSRIALIDAMTGRQVSDKTRQKQSSQRKGKIAHNKGKTGKLTGPCSDTRKKNISISRKLTKKMFCVYCNRDIDPGNYKQFHGENCKLNPNIDTTILQERAISKKQSILKAIQNGNHSPGKNFYKNNPSFLKFTCEHCDKDILGKGAFSKHHGENCKSKPL